MGSRQSVVEESPPPQPVAPVARRRDEPFVGLLDRRRPLEALRPGQRAEQPLSGPKAVTGADTVALDAELHVGLQAEGLAGAGGVGGVAIAGDQRPLAGDAAVVERGLAHELHLDAPLEADHRAHQGVVGVVVGRGPGVRRDRVLPPPRPDRQRVAHLDPALRRVPGRHQRVRARLVGARRGHVDPERREAEGPGLAVEEASEDARRVEGGDAQPVDGAVRSDERAGMAVGQEGVVGDRRERRRCGCALRPGRGRGDGRLLGLGFRGHRAFASLVAGSPLRYPGASWPTSIVAGDGRVITPIG